MILLPQMFIINHIYKAYKMTDVHLINTIKKYSEVPECPTDKFVDSFISNMPSAKTQRNNFHWGYGAIAACLLFAFGIVFYNNMASTNLPTTSVTNNSEYNNVNINVSNDEAADAFATELLDYEDIIS